MYITLCSNICGKLLTVYTDRDDEIDRKEMERLEMLDCYEVDDSEEAESLQENWNSIHERNIDDNICAWT